MKNFENTTKAENPARPTISMDSGSHEMSMHSDISLNLFRIHIQNLRCKKTLLALVVVHYFVMVGIFKS
jgi:hypothetical protein